MKNSLGKNQGLALHAMLVLVYGLLKTTKSLSGDKKCSNLVEGSFSHSFDISFPPIIHS